MIKNTAGIVQGGGRWRAEVVEQWAQRGGNRSTSGVVTGFANGGIVSGPTMGLVGEYPGARQNPEVIAPLNKLQSIIGKSNKNRKYKRNGRG